MSQQASRRASDGDHRHTHFRLDGVTITPGISRANDANARLLSRLLPPDTPVYVGGGASPSRTDRDKPAWWTRTAGRVESFLSSLPPPPARPSGREGTIHPKRATDVTAEEFVASNADDPDVDFLCMAPLSTVAGALRLRSSGGRSDRRGPPEAAFYVMGGIRSDSRATGRGASTAPSGYLDVAVANDEETSEEEAADGGRDRFGEFNFALDVAAARAVLSTASARVIPLEACTLVPESRRVAAEGATLASILSRSRDAPPPPGDDASDSERELRAARGVLLGLLREYGTAETQWDSISAAIYCNAFGTAHAGEDAKGSVLTRVGSNELSLTDLGALSFPGCGFDETMPDACGDSHHEHWIYPTFSTADESAFFRFLSFLLYSDAMG
mmetsp:Transcript_40436/g.86106  ORF Transcript_40436/g.86106 Transcript_40436/m.86106 type:complete len:387 (+) Transcript_40436:282-1442(+)